MLGRMAGEFSAQGGSGLPIPSVAGATTALVLLTALNFVNYIDRYILPGVQEQVKGEFHVSDAQIGSLTFYFNDTKFIMIKPTVLYVLFGGALLGGLAFNRPLLPIMFDGALHVTAEGWRILAGAGPSFSLFWRDSTRSCGTITRTIGATSKLSASSH